MAHRTGERRATLVKLVGVVLIVGAGVTVLLPGAVLTAYNEGFYEFQKTHRILVVSLMVPGLIAGMSAGVVAWVLSCRRWASLSEFRRFVREPYHPVISPALDRLVMWAYSISR